MKTRFASAMLAVTALTSAQGAAAQQAACVEADDLSDTVIYAMPMLYDSVQGPCSSIFAESAFMTNDAGAFVEQFAVQQDAVWPGTLRLLKVFMTANAAKEGADTSMTDAIALMPDDALRPLVDVILVQLLNDRLVKDIKVSTCSDVAEAMELIAPLPPENIAGLASFIARQVDLKDPAICGTETLSAE